MPKNDEFANGVNNSNPVSTLANEKGKETIFLSTEAQEAIRDIQKEPETYKSMLCDAMANLSFLVNSDSSEADLKSAADVLTSLRMYWQLIEDLAQRK